ncbi:MAG TPA: AMP-binding protein [Candidatus Acidoferrales bacterium]|nr:AMP-binding protein [Candidatus Acidoferrales bacterium]
MLENLRAAPEWRPTRPWKEWEAERDLLLHRFVNEQLYPYSPFYRRLFDAHKIKPSSIRRIADLRQLPFTTKHDIAPTPDQPARPLDFVLQPTEDAIRHAAPKAVAARLLFERLRSGAAAVQRRLQLEYQPVHVTYTTGRSAQPTQFLYASMDFERLFVVGKRLMELCGAKMGDRALNVFPFAPHLAFWQTFAVGQAMSMLFVHTGGGKVMGTAGNIAALERLQPFMLIGVPGYIYHMLRQASEQRVSLASLRIIALGAERVAPALKARLMGLCAQMGAPHVVVHGVYGFTEARAAWGECVPPNAETSFGYHTYPDYDVFEIVHPETGEPVGPGERGEIVYTGLSGRGSCVLRYRTGDVAEGGITYDPCPGCGRVVPRISSSISRRSDVGEFKLTKIRGTLVDLNSFMHVMPQVQEVVEWQLVVRKHNDDPDDLDELALYIALRPGCDAAVVKQQIAARLMSAIEIVPNQIEVLPLTQLEENLGLDTQLKETRIRDLRNVLKAPVGQS